MDSMRKLDLLVYAAVCFKHCTSPFEIVHLDKKKVTADECIELSQIIGNVLDEEALLEFSGIEMPNKSLEDIITESMQEFDETQ